MAELSSIDLPIAWAMEIPISLFYR